MMWCLVRALCGAFFHIQADSICQSADGPVSTYKMLSQESPGDRSVPNSGKGHPIAHLPRQLMQPGVGSKSKGRERNRRLRPSETHPSPLLCPTPRPGPGSTVLFPQDLLCRVVWGNEGHPRAALPCAGGRRLPAAGTRTRGRFRHSPSSSAMEEGADCSGAVAFPGDMCQNSDLPGLWREAVYRQLLLVFQSGGLPGSSVPIHSRHQLRRSTRVIARVCWARVHNGRLSVCLHLCSCSCTRWCVSVWCVLSYLLRIKRGPRWDLPAVLRPLPAPWTLPELQVSAQHTSLPRKLPLQCWWWWGGRTRQQA